MKSATLALSLVLSAALAACGDAPPPDEPEVKPAASSLPNPFDVLAAMPVDPRPYGLDVYAIHCLSCHGALGLGDQGNPALKGLNRAVLHQKLLDYRAGRAEGEPADAMTQAVAKLSDAEIAAVSIYAGE